MGILRSGGSVGLDIDTGIIRVVELKGKAKTVNLSAAGRIEIPSHVVEEGMVTDIDTVADALKELWKDARISSRDVTVGISNQGVLMRMARFPKLLEKNLAKAVRFQVGDYFPIPLDQLVLDFSLTGEVEGENGSEMEVLLVAARRDILERCLGALSAASLRPLVVDASSLALLRTLPEDRQSGNVALLDISNGRNGSLLIAEKGVPRLARVISQSPYDREMELIKGSRELVATTIDDDQEQIIDHRYFDEWVMALANEVRSSIGYYMSQRNTESVGTVILSGRGARFESLPVKLEEEMDISVEIIKPLVRLNGPVSGNYSFINNEEPDFAVSIGLALRGLESR
jgi:type IV pilus assembly protein PilM